MRNHEKDKKILSDRALERIMQDVLRGLQMFSSEFTDLARPQKKSPAEFTSRPLPLFTSLDSADLFKPKGKINS